MCYLNSSPFHQLLLILSSFISTSLLPPSLSTTGFRFFAECLRHSAKAILHSTKALPSAALGKAHTVKNWSAKHSLPSVFYRALGKGGGHSTKKSDRHGAGPVDGHFAECQPCRHSAKIFYFFKKKSLPSANPSGTWQRVFIFFLQNFFAEC